MLKRLILALALFLLPASAHAVLDDVHQWSTTAASNTDVGGVNTAEGWSPSTVNNAIREMMAEIRRGVANKGTDISSVGGAPAICATGTSIYVDITGTTTITSFGAANAGCWRILQFDGALTLTHNATSLIIPGGANITTAAGDVLGVISEGSGNWRVIFYSRVPYLAAANTFTAAQTISSTAAGELLTITSTDAGAGNGPSVNLYRNSASPAASDELGQIDFNGEDSVGNTQPYGAIDVTLLDATSTSEDGKIRILPTVAGSQVEGLIVSNGVIAGTSAATFKGNGTLNAEAGLYVNGHGTVAQVVRDTEAVYTTLGTILPIDDTIPQNTEGDEVMTVAITPTNASSTLLIDVHANIGAGGAGDEVACAVFVDTTADAIAAAQTFGQNTGTMMALDFNHTLSAGSTTARTYKVRCGGAAAADSFLNGTTASRMFGGVAISSITVTEILPQ